MKILTDFLNKIQVKKSIIISAICIVLKASLLMTCFFIGSSPALVSQPAILSTTSMPSVTLPKAAY